MRRVGPDEAADVVAETFLVAWTSPAAERSDSLPWLYGVAHNVIRTSYRSSARYSRLRASIPVPESAPSAETVAVARLRIIEALESMSELDAEIVLLAAWEGLTANEIAESVGMRSAAVRMRLSRARRSLASSGSDASAPRVRPHVERTLP